MVDAVWQEGLLEHRFWLQIMGDHARFLTFSLAATEEESIRRAAEFIRAFDRLLDIARQTVSEEEYEALSEEAKECTHSFREFKLQLQSLTLFSKLKIHLSSTFFNHMINELDEYLFTLRTIRENKRPVFHPLHYHLLWLSDGAAHANGVSDFLDETEKDLIAKSDAYSRQFTDLYIKAIETNGYLRTNLRDFPALSRLNRSAYSAMVLFKEFLEDLAKMRADGQVLGTLMPLMADHMAREECYYLEKLSQSADLPKPDCSPTRPRFEA